MGSRVADNMVSNLFKGVPYSKELAEQKEKVAQLESKPGIWELPVEQIEPNPDQPRKTFTDQGITLLARSLERDQQQQPITVFTRGKGKYFLFDGERRWRAAQKLGWKTIQAIVVPDPQAPDALHRKALLANHHRENMNPLDLAEALIKESSTPGKVDEEEVPRLLNTAVKRLLRTKKLNQLTEMVAASREEQEEGLRELEDTGEITPEESHVLQVLLSLQLNPHSTNTNVMPSLRLFDDLKEAIRKRGLGVHHGFALQQLSANNLNLSEEQSLQVRQALTEMVIEQKLSVAQTRKRVKDELSKSAPQEEQLLGKQAQKALGQIQKMKVERMERTELEALEAALKQKLKEVRANLKSS